MPLRFIVSSAGATLAALLLAEQLTIDYNCMDALVSMSGDHETRLEPSEAVRDISKQMTTMCPVESAAGGCQKYDLCRPAHLLVPALRPRAARDAGACGADARPAGRDRAHLQQPAVLRGAGTVQGWRDGGA